MANANKFLRQRRTASRQSKKAVGEIASKTSPNSPLFKLSWKNYLLVYVKGRYVLQRLDLKKKGHFQKY
jgi:hypothetical protein